MNRQYLIEEIKSDFSKYSDAGLIDEISIQRDIEKGLKRFGNDVMELQETVIQVTNGFANLPEGFFALYIAYLCEPLGYSTNKVSKPYIVESNFFIERTQRKSNWNSCDPCCVEEEEKVITETLYLNDNKVDFHYKNPRLLRLGKSFNKTKCHEKCRNKFIWECPEEIVINNNTLYANFDEGNIYMQYYGLPLDEDGEIDIPNTPNGHLDTYLEYFIKRRLAERLLGNNDAVGLSNLYSIYKQEEQIALRNASNELKMSKLTPKSFKRMKRINDLERLKYEINFPII